MEGDKNEAMRKVLEKEEEESNSGMIKKREQIRRVYKRRSD